MPLYEFVCPAGHLTEKRVTDYGLYSVVCGCGADASRNAINRINFGGFTSATGRERDYAEDYRRFTEASSEVDYKATRLESEGATVPPVDVVKQAKRKARSMAAAGVSADSIKL